MLVYSICYYYGKNKTKNILNHIKVFEKINDTQKIFVIANMIDDLNNLEDSEKFLGDIIKQTNPFINYKIITTYNWGGTIAGLWITYNYVKDTYNDDCLVAMFEEDFYATVSDNSWLEESKRLLTENTIYVGETTIGRLKRENDDNRLTSHMFKNSVRLGNPEVWTDGGYYFSNLSKLKKIADKIGVFHKGDQSTKYEHIKDGIDIGEVGFPTLVYHAGFEFTCLHRKNYFVHDE